jgi:hypothetical protein
MACVPLEAGTLQFTLPQGVKVLLNCEQPLDGVSGYVGQLFHPETPRTMVAVSDVIPFGVGAAAGTLDGGTINVPGTPGTNYKVVLRVWNLGDGATYSLADANGRGAQSEVVTVVPGGRILNQVWPPGGLTELQPFCLYAVWPEQVLFSNNGAGILAPMFGPEPTNPCLVIQGNTPQGIPAGEQSYSGERLARSRYTAELWVGTAGDDPLALRPAGRTSFGLSGLFLGKVIDLPLNVSEGSYFQVRIWDNPSGVLSWEDLKDPNTARGVSRILPLRRRTPLPPGEFILAGLESFNLAKSGEIAITAHPLSQSASEGASVTFSVAANGADPLKYQWQKDGAPIPAAKAASLILSSLSSGDAGDYVVTISNACGSVTSRSALLVITPPPVLITISPQSQSVSVGAQVTFTVVAMGGEPLAYQWQFNGEDIAGAVNPLFTIPDVNPTHAGSYRVIVSNSEQSQTSTAAVLTVLGWDLLLASSPAEGGTVTGAGNFAAGTNAAITATPSSGWRFVNWSGPGVADPSAVVTSVTMTGHRLVTAHFVRTWQLTLGVDPVLGGTVSGEGTFDQGTLAPIIATPALTFRFVRWEGTGVTDPQASSTTVLLDQNRCVTAVFTANLPSSWIELDARVTIESPLTGNTPLIQFTIGGDPTSLQPHGQPRFARVGAMNFHEVVYPGDLGISVGGEFYVRIWAWEPTWTTPEGALAAGAPVAVSPKFTLTHRGELGAYTLPSLRLTLSGYEGWNLESDGNLSLHLLTVPLAFSPSRRFTLVGAAQKALLIDVLSGDVVQQYDHGTDEVASVALSPYLEFVLIVTGEPSQAILYDTPTGKALLQIAEQPLPQVFNNRAAGEDVPVMLTTRSASHTRLLDTFNHTLSMTALGDNLQLEWSHGALQIAAGIDGPWNTAPALTSPARVNRLQDYFYRVSYGLEQDTPLPPETTIANWWRAVEDALERQGQNPPPLDLSSIASKTDLSNSLSIQDHVVQNLTPAFTSFWEGVETLYEQRAHFLINNLRFDYSMQERYGIDRNHDGNMDLPNSREYVHNVDPAASLPATPTFVVAFYCPFNPRTGALSAGPPPPDVYEYEWALRGIRPEAAALVTQSSDASRNRIWRTRLPEGHYEVTLTVIDSRIPFIPIKRSLTKEVRIEDLLVVSIGDSYSSGEGNPEAWIQERRLVETSSPFFPYFLLTGLRTRFHDVWWADDGVGPSRGPSTTYVGPFEQVSEHLSLVEQQHLRAHRSTLAWPSQVAWDLERLSPRSSVTFLALPVTGARVRVGVLNPTAGADHPVGTKYLPSQMYTLKQLIGARKIDLVLVSIGGNDVGFSQLVLILMLYDYSYWDAMSEWARSAVDQARSKLISTFETGSFKSAYYDPDSDKPEQFSNVEGLGRLRKALADLANALTELGVDADDVYQIEYPDLFTNADGKPCHLALTHVVETVFGGNMGKRLEQQEMAWAMSALLPRLNTQIALACEDSRWTFVTGIRERFKGHGVCTPRIPFAGNPYPSRVKVTTDGLRWIRAGLEAEEIQGPHGSSIKEYGLHVAERIDTLGMLHPTDIGHQIIKQEVLKVLRPRIEGELLGTGEPEP